MNRYLALLLSLLITGSAAAQERLTLQDAIARTLKHNFDINISQLSLDQAIRNNTLGNAGFAPNIYFSSNFSVSNNNIHSELSNGSEQNSASATNTNINPGIFINWTIFDGGKMFLVKKSLNETQALTEVQLRAQVQTMVSRTIQTYASVVLQQKQLVAIDTAMYLAKVRIQLTKLKYETGAGAKVDYLQAMVDFNSAKSDSLNAVASYAQASDSLSVLMGENADRPYKVDDTMYLNLSLQPIDKERLKEENLTLNSYRRSADISRLNVDIANTYFLPSVNLSGGYAYARNTNGTGFALFSRSYGPFGTLAVSMPIFQGGNLRRQSKVASLQAMKDELAYEKENSIIGKQFRTAWRTYQISVASYHLAIENLTLAKENLDVQLARFRVGVGTTLESKEAENSYVQALVRLYNAGYNVKVNETIVLELQNQLVK